MRSLEGRPVGAALFVGADRTDGPCGGTEVHGASSDTFVHVTTPLMRLQALPLLLLCPLLSISAEGEKPITSKIAEAKVFLSGAQVSRTASATVPTGTSTFVFTGLAQGIDPLSIQVTGKGAYQILSVNHRINYLTESPKKKEIEDLQARIKKLEKDWAFEKAMQDVWVTE